LSTDIGAGPHATFTLYCGFAQGKSVIQEIYPRGKNAHLGYAEVTYRF